MASRKRKRTVLEPVNKSEIVKFAELHPRKSQQDIASHFSALWGYEVKRRTVGDILAQKDKWQPDNIERASKVARLAKEPELEEMLYLWFCNARAQNAPVTDELLRQKAREFGAKRGITDFAILMAGFSDSRRTQF